jgi:LacI family transcriptional regulator
MESLMSTIVDVARLAGVSTATVSRVINSPDRVREETRVKVERAMDLCNYKYNALARGFATKQSRTIGLIIPTIKNSVFAESTRGVQDYADERQNQVILGNTYYQYHQEEKLIKTLLEKRVDGLVITTTNPKGAILKSLEREGVPFVLLYSTLRGGAISAVGIDNYRGGYLATEHLINLGHRRIGMVAGRFTMSDRSLHRWHGYRHCLKTYGIPYDKELLIQTEHSLPGGKESAQRLLSLKTPPTALFCSNDYLALGAMKGARELGMVLPDDLSVVGFDDILTASYIVPELTTVYQPAYEMGKQGAQLLFELMENKHEKAVQMMLEAALVVRDSTAPPGC